jgi:hypothetical protein
MFMMSETVQPKIAASLSLDIFYIFSILSTNKGLACMFWPEMVNDEYIVRLTELRIVR